MDQQSMELVLEIRRLREELTKAKAEYENLYKNYAGLKSAYSRLQQKYSFRKSNGKGRRREMQRTDERSFCFEGEVRGQSRTQSHVTYKRQDRGGEIIKKPVAGCHKKRRDVIYEE